MKVPANMAAEWRARLAASGFDDIELPDGALKEPAHKVRSRLRQPAAGANAEYYRLAAQWTHVAIWSNRRRRRLWELHAEGADEPTIKAAFGPSPSRHHRFIWPWLQEIKAEMFKTIALPEPSEPTTMLELELADVPVFDRGLNGIGEVESW